jgi:thiamine-phosphate pyrophosphorylase
MELIVISSPTAVADENIIINNLFQAGLKYFHLRKPESDEHTVRELIDRIAPHFYDRISLHQFQEIAPDYGIKRLHYTEHARQRSSTENLATQKANGYTLSTSVHDMALLPSLSDFDYTFYGPVFNSISKPGYNSALPADFKLTKRNSKTRLIALGGIDASNLMKTKAMGFDGAAVLGSIWASPASALINFRKLNEIYTYQDIQ